MEWNGDSDGMEIHIVSESELNGDSTSMEWNRDTTSPLAQSCPMPFQNPSPSIRHQHGGPSDVHAHSSPPGTI